jgi:hypothetical protein
MLFNKTCDLYLKIHGHETIRYEAFFKTAEMQKAISGSTAADIWTLNPEKFTGNLPSDLLCKPIL